MNIVSKMESNCFAPAHDDIDYKPVEKPILSTCHDLLDNFNKNYKNTPVNTNTTDFIDCDICGLCLPKYCSIEYENSHTDCVYCLITSAVNKNVDDQLVIKENLNQLLDCVVNKLGNPDKKEFIPMKLKKRSKQEDE